ncbi:MAG: penicillin acylase family protein [Bryobacterales bacterium]|nr:penicillin acylase family protein [Bryobacterales bacterium]
MKRLVAGLCLFAAALAPLAAASPTVELVRDRWGVPHVFAGSEEAGFFGVGFAAAEDRRLQMDLLRRRARGRLSEVFGASQLDSDRRARTAGVGRYCDEAAANLPDRERAWLRAYADGVNAWTEASPEAVTRRFAPLGVRPQPWTAGDCICAWMGLAEAFDGLWNPNAIPAYEAFRRRMAEIGEEAALSENGSIIDDEAAIVPESEMARLGAVYDEIKATPPTPGYWFRSLPAEQLKFSHAWAVGGEKSVTGKPLLQGDPQVPVSNPALWYEFHLHAGTFNVRGISVAGSPGMLVGFNDRLAWGASALGTGSTATFLDRRRGDGYEWRGRTYPFERQTETIAVRGARSAAVERIRTRHGFVFGGSGRDLHVSHYAQIEDRASSIRGMLGMMAARSWEEFRQGMEHYYSPGIHIVYADVAGNVGYQTLLRPPQTAWTRRMALEGWTGRHEIASRIPLDHLPWMWNPKQGFVSHANNMPAGSWYPHDLAIGSGGVGHSARSWRLVQLLSRGSAFSLDSFEAAVHRDDQNATVTALLPFARRLAERSPELANAPGVRALLGDLAEWDFRYRSAEPTYRAAMALSQALVPVFRSSPLAGRVGGGDGGLTHFARRLTEQYPDGGIPNDPDARAYLADWLRAAALNLERLPAPLPVVQMPYQRGGPLAFPPIDPALDRESPPLSCTQGGSIWSQQGNSYSQIVDLADPDRSRSVLPPGVSEDPTSPYFLNQVDLWVDGTTHPAPLSRDAVLAIAESRRTVAVTLSGSTAPRLRTGPDGFIAGHITVMSNGEAVVQPASDPIGSGVAYLTAYGSNLRGASIAEVAGQPAEILYAGPQGQYDSLDQINLKLPASLGGYGKASVVVWRGDEVSNAGYVQFGR